MRNRRYTSEEPFSSEYPTYKLKRNLNKSSKSMLAKKLTVREQNKFLRQRFRITNLKLKMMSLKWKMILLLLLEVKLVNLVNLVRVVPVKVASAKVVL